MGLNEERDQTLNQLLTELDGFEARPGVLLLAATNRTEVGLACKWLASTGNAKANSVLMITHWTRLAIVSNA